MLHMVQVSAKQFQLVNDLKEKQRGTKGHIYDLVRLKICSFIHQNYQDCGWICWLDLQPWRQCPSGSQKPNIYPDLVALAEPFVHNIFAEEVKEYVKWVKKFGRESQIPLVPNVGPII